jgi:uncharacterized protein YjiS (DUF1127 family)
MATIATNPISALILRQFALLGAFRRKAADTTDLKRLSADQLLDAGIDPSTVISGPVYEVDVTTMTRLMAMR